MKNLKLVYFLSTGKYLKNAGSKKVLLVNNFLLTPKEHYLQNDAQKRLYLVISLLLRIFELINLFHSLNRVLSFNSLNIDIFPYLF